MNLLFMTLCTISSILEPVGFASVLEAVALLEAATTAGSTTWDAGANPDMEIKQDIITLANTSGFYVNRALYGDQAALKRQNAYENQLTAGSIMRAGQYTAEQIATAIGVQQAMISAERYITPGTLSTKQEIIGSNVLLYTAVPESPMDPSNIVRHVSNASYGGGEYAVYVTDIGVKLIALTLENYEYLHVQHTTGIQQITIK